MKYILLQLQCESMRSLPWEREYAVKVLKNNNVPTTLLVSIITQPTASPGIAPPGIARMRTTYGLGPTTIALLFIINHKRQLGMRALSRFKKDLHRG